MAFMEITQLGWLPGVMKGAPNVPEEDMICVENVQTIIFILIILA